MDLRLWKHRLDLENGSKVTSIPPQVPMVASCSVSSPAAGMTGPRTAKMLLPYPHIILGCRPCERFVARRQGDRCMYWPGTCLVTYNDQSVKKRGTTRTGGETYLILTSSNGTTTKLSVAPALQPVMIESFLVISASPVMVLNVFPQKSFAALRVGVITLLSCSTGR